LIEVAARLLWTKIWYSVISVIVDSLAGNTKNRVIDPFVDGKVFHPWADEMKNYSASKDILQGRLIAPFFCLEVLFLFRSLSTDPRTLLCKRRIEDFHQAQIVKFVSFTGAFTGEYVVKSVKETCETVHSIPKETCQNATQFD
jgi:hypothetical protein